MSTDLANWLLSTAMKISFGFVIGAVFTALTLSCDPGNAAYTSGAVPPSAVQVEKRFEKPRGLKASHEPSKSTRKAKRSQPVSRSEDRPPLAKPRVASGFAAWLHSATALRVVWRESRGQCDVVNRASGAGGKWQFMPNTWASNGGLRFAPRAEFATCSQQDQIAYRLWQRRGWQPWTSL